MSPDEKQMLEALFARVKQASNGPRDAEAERLISDQVRQNPVAPYLLAQAVLVQEQALTAANQRILDLEARANELERQSQEKSSGGLFGGLFSSPKPSAPSRSGVPGVGGGYGGGYPSPQGGPVPQGGMGGPGMGGPGMGGPGMGGAGPWGGAQAAQGGGGGFLRGALTTAAGVAGGALLFQGISSMFSGSAAQASGLGNIAAGTPQAAPEAAPASYDQAYEPAAAAEPSYDDASYDDGGFDAGGGDDWA